MITVGGIDHINLRVTDLARALRFYVGLLGLAEVRRLTRPDGSVALVALRAGPQLVFLQPQPTTWQPAAEPTQGLDHYSLTIEPVDPDTLVAWLRQHQVPIVEGPVDRFGAAGDGISVYVRDPDGHQIELKQYPQLVRAGASARAGADQASNQG